MAVTEVRGKAWVMSLMHYTMAGFPEHEPGLTFPVNDIWLYSLKLNSTPDTCLCLHITKGIFIALQ